MRDLLKFLVVEICKVTHMRKPRRLKNVAKSFAIAAATFDAMKPLLDSEIVDNMNFSSIFLLPFLLLYCRRPSRRAHHRRSPLQPPLLVLLLVME